MKKQRLSLVWRTLIVFFAAVIIWLIIGGVNDWVTSGDDYDLTAHIISSILTTILVIPMVICARKYLDQRSWKGLQLTSFKKGWKSFIIGGLTYFIPAMLSLIIFLMFGWIEISLQASFSEAFLQVILVVTLIFLFEALPEELIFRGYFYRNLNTSFSKTNAVLIQSVLFVLFGVLIGAAGNIGRITMFFAISIVIGVIRVNTGNVWSAVGFHLVFQTMQQMFQSTHNNTLTSSAPELMEIIVLGMIPFAFATMILKFFIKEEPDWEEVNPE